MNSAHTESHRLPTDQVQVQVKDNLTRMRAGIGDEAVAAVVDAFLLGQDAGQAEQAPHSGLVCGDQFINGCDVVVGDDQNMGGGDGVNVAESGDQLIPVNDLSGGCP